MVPCLVATAGAGEFRLSLLAAEKAALSYSADSRAARDAAQAGHLGAQVQRAARYPRFSLDGSYRYLTEIPTLKVSPASPEVRLGDNNNYSYGPSVQWLLWDTGGVDYAVRALSAQANSRDLEARALEKRVLLTTRLSYFQVLAAVDQVLLFNDAVELAAAQWQDIRLREAAGTASRQEVMQARGELLDRQARRRQAQTQLAGALEDLGALAGLEVGDTTRPWPAGSKPKGPVEGPVTLWIKTDDGAVLRQTLGPAADRAFKGDLPELAGWDAQAEAARASARSARAAYGPSLLVNARASRDYPNGPISEEINQRTVGAAVTWPLWEGGRTVRESEKQEVLARAAEEKRDQGERDFYRDWRKARARLAGLREVETLQKATVDERAALSKLVYESYQAGRVPYLEVQNASWALLRAETDHLQTVVDILSQLALLDHLTTP